MPTACGRGIPFVFGQIIDWTRTEGRSMSLNVMECFGNQILPLVSRYPPMSGLSAPFRAKLYFRRHCKVSRTDVIKSEWGLRTLTPW